MTTSNPLQHLAARWPEIDELLDEALALPPPAWPAWLEGLQQRNPALHDTLAQLLRGHAQAETDDFLNTLSPLSAPESAPDAAAAGRLVGPWRLLSPLGSGGMGTVWRAERADGTVKRQVALKLPRLGWDDAMAQRMARERDILAALEHPHIARLYEASVDPDGRPYLAMELVQGEPIDAWCAARALPVRGRLDLLLQVAQAVSHAHAQLVVHRDLKPANILVTAEGQVSLLDFGIAKLLDGDRTQDTALTQMAGRAMTLAYASPEQIRGEPLSTASDLYSLGVVAYELLTGVRPHLAKRRSAAELEELIENTAPPLASRLAAEPAVRKALQGDLDAILNQALKKRPADRYASVADFARDIERHLAHKPVQARPDSRGYRLAKFVDRYRFGVAAAVTLALAVAAGTATSLWQAAQARQQAARAEAARSDQRAVNDFFVESFTRLSAVAAADAASLARPHAVSGVLEAILQTTLPRYANRPTERQALLRAVAVQLNYASDFERALTVGRTYLDDLKTHGATADTVVHAHAMLGRTLVSLGRLDEAVAVRRAGVAWRADADDPRTLGARLDLIGDLGGLLSRLGQRAEAGQVLQSGADLAAEKLPGHLAHAQVLRQLAMHHAGFDDARALKDARQALAVQGESGMAAAEIRGAALETLGRALARTGQLDEAQVALAQGHALLATVFGRANRNVARGATGWISTVARRGEHDRARQLLADELAALAAVATPAAAVSREMLRARQLENEWLHGDMAAASALLAAPRVPAALLPRDSEPVTVIETRALLDAGRVDDAAARIALAAEKSSQRGLPTAAWFELAQAHAMALLAQGRTAAARQRALDLLALHRGHGGMASWTGVLSAELAALAAARDGDTASAARELDALESSAPPAAPDAVERAESLLRRGEVRRLAGDRAAARAAATAALAALERQHPASPRLLRARALLAQAA